VTSHERFHTWTDDGWRLEADLFAPARPSAVAVLGHAMMVDRRTMDRPAGRGLASVLVARNTAVFNFDLRGHGASGPSARDGARFNYDDIVRFDVPAMVMAARSRFDLPVAFVGHSLAGHAAILAAGLFPALAPDALVALGANLWLPRFDPSLRAKLKKGATLAAWGALTRSLGHFDSRRFGMGSAAEPWPYVDQFVRFYFSNHLESRDGMHDYLGAMRSIERPVLAISSAGDTLLARPESVARFVGELVRAHVTHRVVTSDDISPPPSHMELVTSERSRPVWEEIAAWLHARLSPVGVSVGRSADGFHP
jgi:predicted alpha/beta hydrolase